MTTTAPTAAEGVSAGPAVCAGCDLEIPSRLLACPRCRRLVHAAALNTLAAEAETAAAARDGQTAMASWRRALELLPPDSQQHAHVTHKIESLGLSSEGVQKASPSQKPRNRGGRLAGLGVAGAVLWKFKFLTLLVLTKAKFLLLGFTKIGTVLSALASFGLYWTLWGWRFALGFVVSIYIHEMGHVAALRRYGIPATAPMFIPGIGAFVRLKQNPTNTREDARIALAGPLWGFGAALVAWMIARVTGSGLWLSLAHAGAMLNLFNLLPLGSLDGGRAFRSLSRQQRWVMCALFAAVLLLSGERLVILLLIAGAYRALSKDAPQLSDRGALALFAAITVALAILMQGALPAAVPLPAAE